MTLRPEDRGDLVGLADRTISIQQSLEVLQLCSHPVVGWQDAPPGIFGLWSIQVATI